jgi:hypothetical protein
MRNGTRQLRKATYLFKFDSSLRFSGTFRDGDGNKHYAEDIRVLRPLLFFVLQALNCREWENESLDSNRVDSISS